MELRDVISAWVFAARTKAGLTQEQIGESLGVTKGNVSGWENGRHEPSIVQLLKIRDLCRFPLPEEITGPGAISPEVLDLATQIAALSDVAKKSLLRQIELEKRALESDGSARSLNSRRLDLLHEESDKGLANKAKALPKRSKTGPGAA
jgi:transcriptional regulator with XRE-family HTH domain